MIYNIFSVTSCVVYLGSTQTFKGTKYTCAIIIEHENYNAIKLENDISIIELDRNIEYSDKINSVCLPEKQITESDKYECYVSGFGRLTGTGLSFKFFLSSFFPYIKTNNI